MTMPTVDVEKLARRLRDMDRPALVRMLRKLECGFEMDFTDEFVASLSLTRLRHIVLAAYLHARNAEAAGV